MLLVNRFGNIVYRGIFLLFASALIVFSYGQKPVGLTIGPSISDNGFGELKNENLINLVIRAGVNLPQAVWSPNKEQLRKILEKTGFYKVDIKISPTLNHYIVLGAKK